ncbi:hypothetical protein QFZ43_007336 [Streptomyces afghaniensis]|nr:hypothetical protein [Streptomyces afghaniensis]
MAGTALPGTADRQEPGPHPQGRPTAKSRDHAPEAADRRAPGRRTPRRGWLDVGRAGREWLDAEGRGRAAGGRLPGRHPVPGHRTPQAPTGEPDAGPLGHQGDRRRGAACRTAGAPGGRTPGRRMPDRWGTGGTDAGAPHAGREDATSRARQGPRSTQVRTPGASAPDAMAPERRTLWRRTVRAGGYASTGPQSTVTTILPRVRPSSLSRCASAARSRGNVSETCTLTTPCSASSDSRRRSSASGRTK